MNLLLPGASDEVFAAAESKAHLGEGTISRVIGCQLAPYNPEMPPKQQPAVLTASDIVGLAGAYLYLCRFSDPHERYQYCLLENRVLPSFEWDSYRLYFRDEIPVAYISWTWVDDDVDKRLLGGESALRADDWNRGENFWFMEVLAPFGDIFEVMMDLHENVFTQYPRAMATYIDKKGNFSALRYFTDFESFLCR